MRSWHKVHSRPLGDMDPFRLSLNRGAIFVACHVATFRFWKPTLELLSWHFALRRMAS